MSTSAESSPAKPLAFVPETRFGVWFLATEVWRVHVLGVALDSLQALAPDLPTGGTILDIGTGLGHSLGALAARFQPERIHALDPDPAFPAKAGASLTTCPVPVTVHRTHAEAMDLPDASVDLVFCHQSLHHIVGQERALAEMFRVLKPGGHLLLAESTRRYIHSWIIRLFFRHPMHAAHGAPVSGHAPGGGLRGATRSRPHAVPLVEPLGPRRPRVVRHEGAHGAGGDPAQHGGAQALRRYPG